MAPSCSYAYNISYSTFIQEETWFQGNLLSNVFFGVQSTLCVLTFLAVFRRRTPIDSRVQITLLIYIAVLLAITTIAQGFLIDLIQMAFISQRNYPGGPSAFLSDACTIPANLATNILVVFANWMMESLLVWRCHVVYSGGNHLWWLGVPIPFFLLIAVFVTGSFFIYHILHATPPATYVLAYAVSSLSLNFAATGFIAGRLLFYRHRVASQLGRGYGKQYVSIAAVVVESAAIYTSYLLVVIVAFAIGSPGTNSLQQIIVHVQSITSLLTILRIARGEGWTATTNTELVFVVTSSQAEHVVQLNVVSTQPNEDASVQRKDGREVPNASTQSCGEVEHHVKSGTWTI